MVWYGSLSFRADWDKSDYSEKANKLAHAAMYFFIMCHKLKLTIVPTIKEFLRFQMSIQITSKSNELSGFNYSLPLKSILFLMSSRKVQSQFVIMKQKKKNKIHSLGSCIKQDSDNKNLDMLQASYCDRVMKTQDGKG